MQLIQLILVYKQLRPRALAVKPAAHICAYAGTYTVAEAHRHPIERHSQQDNTRKRVDSNA